MQKYYPALIGIAVGVGMVVLGRRIDAWEKPFLFGWGALVSLIGVCLAAASLLAPIVILQISKLKK